MPCFDGHLAMKKILLLSDTHSYMDNRILEYASQADEIWHAGDFGNQEVIDSLSAVKPLKGVFGNIDDAGSGSFDDAHRRLSEKICSQHQSRTTPAPAKTLYLWAFSYFESYV